MKVADQGEHSDRVAAVRYGVLRKLVPGFRHVLMGQLQAVRWATEAAARGLEAGLEPSKAQESINGALRESIAAIRSSDSILQWLRPTEQRSVNARHGIANSVKLASEDWFLRGIAIRVDLLETDFEVSQQEFQEMTVAALLALADIHQQNADILVHADVVGDLLEIALTASAAVRESSFPMPSDDRRLTWADVELLAATNDVHCECDASGVKLRFNRFRAPGV